MSKQEEIRKKIYDVVLAARTEGIICGKTKGFADSDTEEIIDYLHSQGVVIKVDDKPGIIIEKSGSPHVCRVKYHATMPLVEG